jgi:hypothetical protein
MQESHATLALQGTALTTYNTQNGASAHVVPGFAMKALNPVNLDFLA